MTGIMNLAPDVRGTIESIRSNAKLGWREILGELIDNAFDAGATRVSIISNGRELSVEDDGNGCDDLEKMLTMGRHSRTSTTKLGRYGVGFKDAAWWVGGPTRIETCHSGKLRRIRIDWDAMSDWTLERPVVEDGRGQRGTKITFLSMSKERVFPSGDRLESMLGKLAFTYSPAIKQGKQIVFRRGREKPVVLKAFTLPDIVDKIETTLVVDGKTARVVAGIVPEGVANPEPGLIYAHAFRVITHGALGCGGLGISRIAGWVDLDDKWRLSRNKDAIVDAEKLDDAVFEAIESVVRKASQQAMTMKSAEFTTKITSMFRAMLEGLSPKTKRNPTKNPRGATPGGRTEGPRKGRGRAGNFRIDFMPLGDGAIGRVDPNGIVWLADNHTLVAQARNENDVRAIVVLAAMLFVANDSDKGQPMLPLLRDGSIANRIEIAAGKLLAQQAEAMPALKAVA